MNLSWETISALVLIGSTMGTTIFWTALMLGRFQAQIQEGRHRHDITEKRVDEHDDQLKTHWRDIQKLERRHFVRRENDSGD